MDADLPSDQYLNAINIQHPTSFIVQKVQGCHKKNWIRVEGILFASEMEGIFGKCHSTNPTFVVESSTSSTCTSKLIKKSRSEKQSPSSSSDYSEESISSKGNNKGGGGRKKRKHHRKTGATQCTNF